MHYFEYAEKDSTLYSRSGSQNTGIDEILEQIINQLSGLSGILWQIKEKHLKDTA